jgi:hypothetical protein
MLAEERALDDERQIRQPKNWGSGRKPALPKLRELPEPWARQPEETSKAFAAFAVYRDLGPTRSLAKVGRLLGRSTQGMERWSSVDGWVVRVAAWDNEQDRIRRVAANAEIATMAVRQAREGQLMQAKGIKKIADMTDEDIKLLSIMEATRLVETGVKIERTARGEPTIAPAELVQPPAVPAMRIIEILRSNPSRIGPVIQVLAALREALPELAPGMKDVTPEG